MNDLLITIFIMLSIFDNVNAERRLNKSICSKKNLTWKLKSIIFYSSKALVQNERTLIREVRLDSVIQSTAELAIKKQFKGYSRYVYQNGTVIRKVIKDFGQIPKIVNNKVSMDNCFTITVSFNPFMHFLFNIEFSVTDILIVEVIF